MKLKLGLILFFVVVIAVSAQTNFMNSFDDIKIAYTDQGKGIPVLLIHGFINSKNSWDKTILKKDLLENGYRVIALDLRGNGESGKPQNDVAYHNNAEVKDIILLLDKLKINRCLAVGYSRGSIVLAKLLTVESRIKKAVMGGMGIDFTNPDWDRRILFADAFNNKITNETKGAVNYAKSIGADLKSLHLQQKHQPVTSISELQSINAKVLVLAGNKDLDNGNPEDLQRTIPNAVLKIVEGDHNGTYKTGAFSNEVVKFLQD